MKICPITYEEIQDTQKYSSKGLKRLSPALLMLDDLPLTAHEQRKQAQALSSKMSIQGVQPKLSAILSTKNHRFQIVSTGGRYILKPQVSQWNFVPENEDLTMRLARLVGIETPLHGLVYSKDGSRTYFIRRYDRKGQKGKVHVEDFAQLSGASRDTKYDSSMEKVADIVDQFCSFPVLEKLKLFQRTLFSFMVGNEDMHLKNFSLIVRNDKTELSPAYDLLNSTLVIDNPKEELALPIRGKKNKLDRDDLIEYFAIKRLDLSKTICQEMLETFENIFPTWKVWIDRSFLPQDDKERYLSILKDRSQRLDVKF
ncbi:MAG: HipA domain-containing protein [Bdellovibrionota bacterium]